MNKVKYLVFVFLSLMLFSIEKNSVKAYIINDMSPKVINNTTDEYKITVTNVEGVMSFTTSDDTIVSVNSNGVLTAHKDGIAEITCLETDFPYPTKLDVIVNINGTYSSDLNNIYNTLPNTLNVNFIQDFANVGINQYITGKDYILDIISSKLPELPDNIYYANYELVGNQYKINLQKNFQYGDAPYYKNAMISTPNSKTITINYKPSVAKDKLAVSKALDNLKEEYDCYLNDTFKFVTTADLDVQKKMIKSSNFERDINNKSIIYEMDARMGNDNPEEAMFGGYVRLGINDTMYGVKEIKFYKALKIPKIKDNTSIEKAVENYFRKNFLRSDQDVTVTLDSKGIYKAVITPKQTGSLVTTIMNLLVPKISAAESMTLKFKVVQTDELLSENVLNPNTYDNIKNYIIISIVSSCCLITGLIVTKKSKKN